MTGDPLEVVQTYGQLGVGKAGDVRFVSGTGSNQGLYYHNGSTWTLWTQAASAAEIYPAGADILYTAGTGLTGITGDDGNDGLSPSYPKASLQNAYDSLPSTGGTIMMLGGTYDVDSYTDNRLTLSATKPAHFQSITGRRPKKDRHQTTLWDGSPIIKGTLGTCLVLIDTGFEIGHGMIFRGINFNMLNTSITGGIVCRDMNYLHVEDCAFDGGGQAGYAIRCYCIHSGWGDSSWHRIYNNYARAISLHIGLGLDTYLGSAPIAGGNHNNVQIRDNIVFGNAGYAIYLYNLQRSVIEGNNLEQGASGIYMAPGCKKNAILWQGGEGSTSPYLEFGGTYGAGNAGAYGNWYQNFAVDSGTEVLDGAGATEYAAQNYQMAVKTSQWSVKTADYNLTAWNWHNYLFIMDKATAIGFYIDRQSTYGIPVGASFRVLQQGSGAVTVTKHAAVTINGPTTTSASGEVLHFLKTDAEIYYSYRTTG